MKHFKIPHASHFVYIAMLGFLILTGCATPDSQNNPAPTATPAPQEATESSYMVIPLTTGEVSPISACSYDLLHTVTSIQIFDSTDYSVLNECFAVIDRYEKLLSRTLSGTEVYNINHSTDNTFTVSDDLREILELSLYYGELTDGALDISIAPVSSLWDFSSLEHHAAVPAATELQEKLSLVDHKSITLQGNSLSFSKDGMQLELGAVAKGFIADKVKEFLLSKGVTSAIINLGGNILLVGEKPDGSAFRVGVQKPFEDRDAIVVAICDLKDMSMVSSGIYERYFYDNNNNFYHHILDSKTGYPCDTDLLQVTIISPTSGVGDALSTACFALGLEKGLQLINSIDDVYAVFLTANGTMYFSEGFMENIPTQTE